MHSGRPINLHLVSDSTGETLNSIARATLARFEDPHVIHHRWSLIRSRLQLDRVLEGIEVEPGPVLFTLVDSQPAPGAGGSLPAAGLPCTRRSIR
jgi:[pyruvate, water dikinase]-phosphate phosphotransferase / [pyruvate, water dikinase] kinase